MLRRSLLIFAAANALALPTPSSAKDEPKLDAPAGTYVLEKTHGSILWRVSHMGMSNYTARFKTFDAKVQYDPKDIGKNRVEATIDLASVETDFVPQAGRDFNAELKSEPFFNVGKFAQAKFVSKAVRAVAARRMEVTGDLTLLGITKPVVLNVTMNGAVREHPFAKVPWIGISAAGKVKRSAYGLNPMPQLTGIGDDVEIIIEGEFIKQQ